jgi:hypothetical protein
MADRFIDKSSSPRSGRPLEGMVVQGCDAAPRPNFAEAVRTAPRRFLASRPSQRYEIGALRR